MRLKIHLTLSAVLFLAAGYGVAQTPVQSAGQRENALALERLGKNIEAEAAWKQVLDQSPSSPEAYAHLGLLEARQEHYKEAVPLYRKALELGPQIASVQLNLGLALFKGGELRQSIEVFDALLKNQPADSPQAVQLSTLLGMAHYGLGDYALAVPYLQEAATADALNLELKLVLAHSCLWSKQNQCILDVYHEILAQDQNSAAAYMLAGEALDGMRDRAGAIQQFQAAIKANPKEPEVHWDLGFLLWEQSQFNPGLALIHLDLGIVYGDTERRDDALRELKLAEQIDPNDQNVHWRLGHLYQLMGDNESAKAEFDTLHSLKDAVQDDLNRKLHDSELKAMPAADASAAPDVK
jgi:tetratricopeptide (TPR) repeat protein